MSESVLDEFLYDVSPRGALAASLGGALRSRIQYRLCARSTMQHTATLSNRRQAAVAKRASVVCRELRSMHSRRVRAPHHSAFE